MRNDVMMRLVRQAMEDEGFRREAQADLEGALAAHGYRLQPDELAAVQAFQTRIAGRVPAEVTGHLLRLTRGTEEML